MTSTAIPTTAPAVVAQVLDQAAAALTARAEADVALLVAAAEWADLHPATDGEPYAGWGESDLFDKHGEGLTPIAGPGAPLVAEFAPFELAAALGWTPNAALELMADAHEIHHRLPRLWDLVLELEIPVHLARHVATHTTDLSPVAARYADRLVCADPARATRIRIERLVDEARLYYEPDHAVAREQAALAARKVRLRPGAATATTDVSMTLDTPDALAFDKTLSALARSLRDLGDDDPLDVRRARAVGILADPQQALDLLHPDGAGQAPARTPVAPTLYLRLSDAALLQLGGGRPGPVTAERLGVLSTDLLKQWLTGSTVVVRPVLDLARTDAVDQHDPPEWMADLVRLRDPVCVFPSCQIDSRRCDLDHIEAYQDPDDPADPGPPGQTHPHNLAPLCRRHHRAKTHGRWTYRRRPDGSYLWTSPSGRTYDVPATPRPRPPA